MEVNKERIKVFIPDESLIWVAGDVLNELSDGAYEIEITDLEYLQNTKNPRNKTVSLKNANKGLDTLPLQNNMSDAGADDMTTLNYLHEASILDNLRRRFAFEKPYTYTGDICIAVGISVLHYISCLMFNGLLLLLQVNPYQWLDLYSPALRYLSRCVAAYVCTDHELSRYSAVTSTSTPPSTR